jgi:hypothetical protein
MVKILLFDVDGVLIKPIGYRKAYFDTCAWIIEQTGMDASLPGKDIPALFESYGVTSEWDMLALTMSILMESFCQQTGWVILSGTVAEMLLELSARQYPKVEVNYRQSIQQLSDLFHLGDIPSLAVYQHCQPNHFACLNQQALLEDILCHTRSVQQCFITSLFQNFVLGKDQYQENYRLPARLNCESYLRTYDQALISPKWTDWIRSADHDPAYQFAALTARPSLGPRMSDSGDFWDYSPEAELALDVIKLPELCLMGYGRLQFIAADLGTHADSLIKPSPFHALAAIFAILSGSEKQGLQIAAAFVKDATRASLNALLEAKKIVLSDAMEIAVFEDSQGGVRSVLGAVEMLQNAGILVTARIFGVTENVDKIQSLNAVGATVFSIINEALEAYI